MKNLKIEKEKMEITRIYDLREEPHKWKHTETTSHTVTFSKQIGSVRWDVVEYTVGHYYVCRNGVAKTLPLDTMEEVVEFLKENKLLNNNE